MTETACTARLYGDHDYSQPPHNTPDDPRDAEDTTPCQARSAKIAPCTNERDYELIIFQIASHDWIRMFACVPCTADLRVRHHKLGLGGTEGIARIRSAQPL